MTTLVTHAAMPVIARTLVTVPPALRTRLLMASMACACAADLDVVGFAFSVRATEPWGHRGLLHSLPVAVVLSVAVGFTLFWSVRRQRQVFLTVLACLFVAGASHGLLDALTHGDVGVALLAPFSERRFLVPWGPVPVAPLGVYEMLGRWGALTVLDEALLLLAPFALLIGVARRLQTGAGRWPRLTVVALAWLGAMLTVRTQLPELTGRTLPRVAARVLGGTDDDLNLIPTDGLPGQELATRFEQWQAQGLLGRDLEPGQQPWSAGFFPYWYGGEAGRWRDGPLRLIWRTLARVEVPRRDDAAPTWLRSPTEKYDLMVGDDDFGATRTSLALSHNASPRPRFWYGLCNGVAAASLQWPEPHLVVDVTSPSGQAIRFHPNDIKALLAASYYWTSRMTLLGGSCDQVSFDSGRRCSMNPVGLVTAVVNRLGLAHRSFLVDVHPSPQSQYYAVASGRVDVRHGPHPLDDTPLEPTLANDAVALVDVDVTLQLSSTTLSNALADRRLDDTHYQLVGVHQVPFTWSATLALDAAGHVVGGRWTGQSGNGPDNVMFVSSAPLLTDAGTLELNPRLEWARVEALARASAGLTDAGAPP